MVKHYDSLEECIISEIKGYLGIRDEIDMSKYELIESVTIEGTRNLKTNPLWFDIPKDAEAIRVEVTISSPPQPITINFNENNNYRRYECQAKELIGKVAVERVINGSKGLIALR